jgi:hypothetical protein
VPTNLPTSVPRVPASGFAATALTNLPTPIARVPACGYGAIGTDEFAETGRFGRSRRHLGTCGRRSVRPKRSAPTKSAQRNLPDRAWRFGPTATLSGRGDNTACRRRLLRPQRSAPANTAGTGRSNSRVRVKQPASAKRLADTPPPLASGERIAGRRLSTRQTSGFVQEKTSAIAVSTGRLRESPDVPEIPS